MVDFYGDIMNIVDNAEEILNKHIFGFHICSLDKPFGIMFASQSFCELLDVEQEEWVSNRVKFIQFVHAEDREMYEDFLLQLSRAEQTKSIQYRLVLKNGTILFINDTITSRKNSAGQMVGYCTLNDMTQLITDEQDLFLGKGNPCGFIKYTCEKQPRITYLNNKMKEILRIPQAKDGELDYLELYTSNIYLIVPVEERKKFHHLLNRVVTNNETITGEFTVLRCDGTKAQVFGWITKQKNERGVEEFQSVLIDVSERYDRPKDGAVDIYINLLSQVYEKIYSYDYANKTVKCVFDRNTEVLPIQGNMFLNMDDAIQDFVSQNVSKKDQSEVQLFFQQNYERRYNSEDYQPLQTRFAGSDMNKLYGATFIKINLTVSLLCIRSLEEMDTNALVTENITLKNMQENMRKLFMRLTEGIVAFQIDNYRVKLLHTSENVSRFLGMTDEDMESIKSVGMDIEEAISKSEVLTQEKVDKLLSSGEAIFPYFDTATGKNKRIKALCTQESIDDAKSRFVILYNIPDEGRDDTRNLTGKKVYVRTFGYFDVFVNDKPIAFKNKKSKELLALLVDRRGGFVTSEEAIGFLWENEDANSVTLARCRKVALRLKNILEEHGIADIMESVDGKRRIDTTKIQCDLIDYLSGKEEYSQLFKGAYLTNYSWGEITLSELLGKYYD